MNDADKKLVGALGEEIASRFLTKHGFKVVDRNYRKKWGEIDVIAEKGGELRFVEVKTVSRENVGNVTREPPLGEYRPEDNVHPWKIKRLSRAIQSYLIEKNVPDEAEWQLDLVTVYLNLGAKKAKVELLENVTV